MLNEQVAGTTENALSFFEKLSDVDALDDEEMLDALNQLDGMLSTSEGIDNFRNAYIQFRIDLANAKTDNDRREVIYKNEAIFCKKRLQFFIAVFCFTYQPFREPIITPLVKCFCMKG